ncbi:hypothetical protein BGZ52_006019 [Haplosporangium bisporale]|nr:hypothetical protein BGZ52_006019 [Haplosporangium bisporale]
MADLSITAPNTTSFVRAGGQLPISWSFSGSYPATISIELVDNSKQLFTGPLALFSNLQTTSGLASWTIPKLGFVGDKFSLILVANIGGTATILAQGPEFSIKAEGTPGTVSRSSPRYKSQLVEFEQLESSCQGGLRDNALRSPVQHVILDRKRDTPETPRPCP